VFLVVLFCPLSTLYALFLFEDILGDLTGDFMGSRSESSSPESEDKESTLCCFKSVLEIKLALVCLEVFVLRLEMLAALELSHGGDARLARTFFQEKLSLLDGLGCGSRFVTDCDLGSNWSP